MNGGLTVEIYWRVGASSKTDGTAGSPSAKWLIIWMYVLRSYQSESINSETVGVYLPCPHIDKVLFRNYNPTNGISVFKDYNE
jgi:hypothetical protein